MIEGNLTTAREYEDKMLHPPFFRYTDLSMELQDMILEIVIVATEEEEEDLPSLAVVCREWQERIEKITFTSMGQFLPKDDDDLQHDDFSYFRAIDLDEF